MFCSLHVRNYVKIPFMCLLYLCQREDGSRLWELVTDSLANLWNKICSNQPVVSLLKLIRIGERYSLPSLRWITLNSGSIDLCRVYRSAIFVRLSRVTRFAVYMSTCMAVQLRCGLATKWHDKVLFCLQNKKSVCGLIPPNCAIWKYHAPVRKSDFKFLLDYRSVQKNWSV